MKGIKIDHVSRYFNDNVALADVSLEVKEGEFFSLLGPSGCGKSTLLNIIAGFLEPTDGLVYIGNQNVTNLPPYRRNIGMVFQNYALFPHLTVFENVAYGLKIKKLPRKEIEERVMDALSLVQLSSFAKRRPHQLSGGQQQRVAIARALAIQPSILLLDEPLSNLDAKLRKDMQFELRNIQQRVGITTVLVTHDQEEALSLSDRIGILGNGHLQQVGSPLEVYRKPANRFVAEFIGQVNLFEAIVRKGANEKIIYEVENYQTENNEPLLLDLDKTETNEGDQVLVMLRPERIQISTTPLEQKINSTKVKLLEISYIGNALRIKAQLHKGEILIHTPDLNFVNLPKIGDELYVYWDGRDLIPLEEGE